MDNMQEELKDQIAKFQAIQKRIEGIPKEVMITEKRIEEKKKQLDQILADIENTRKQRQNLLVNGGKIEPVSRKIKDLWESCDLIEDEILGLKNKIRDLHTERDKLIVDKDFCQDEVIRGRIYPLVDVVNSHLEKGSGALNKIYSIFEEYGLSFAEPKGWGRFISCSNWIGLRIIPRLSRASDELGEDFWNITEMLTKKQREQQEAAYKLSQHTPGPEA